MSPSRVSSRDIGIPVTKKKFAELELSLLHLQQNVEIPYLSYYPQVSMNTPDATTTEGLTLWQDHNTPDSTGSGVSNHGYYFTSVQTTTPPCSAQGYSHYNGSSTGEPPCSTYLVVFADTRRPF